MQNLVQLVFSAPLWLLAERRRYYDPQRFAATRAVLDQAEGLVEEACRLLDRGLARPIQEIDEGQRRLNRDTGWRLIVFRAYGRDVETNLRSAPRHAALLRDHPELVSATLSVLEPGKRIPLHPGPFKGVLRVHLGIQVPSSGRAFLEVGGHRRAWGCREVLVFDDTYPHRARNETDEIRTVLLLDMVRPLRWQVLRRLNRSMIAWLGRRHRVLDMVEASEQRAQTSALRCGPEDSWLIQSSDGRNDLCRDGAS